MKRTVFYSGSFDPMTNGHLDIVKQCFVLADEIVIGVGVHPGKQAMFSFEERAELINKSIEDLNSTAGVKVSVQAFDNLVVDAAADAGATIIARGVRDGSDLDYEMHMAGMNGAMAPGIKTVLLPASPDVRHITGTLVRQIAKMGGDVSSFVPAAVLEALKAKTA